MRSLARTLKRLRRHRGLTQMQVATRARISQGFLSDLESGTKTVVSLPVATRLAKALGVELGELVK
jgi:transcriptional regulator with XRE-family HTH domain